MRALNATHKRLIGDYGLSCLLAEKLSLRDLRLLQYLLKAELMHRSNQHSYSINSSARPSTTRLAKLRWANISLFFRTDVAPSHKGIRLYRDWSARGRSR